MRRARAALHKKSGAAKTGDNETALESLVQAKDPLMSASGSQIFTVSRLRPETYTATSFGWWVVPLKPQSTNASVGLISVARLI